MRRVSPAVFNINNNLKGGGGGVKEKKRRRTEHGKSRCKS